MAVFDSIADEYDKWYKSKMGRFVDEVETRLVFDMFLPRQYNSVLDVGCGTGNFSIKLAMHNCKVTGIDLSREMLAAARRKAGYEKPDILFKQMDVYNLEFPDRHFDDVFSVAAFEFITEPQRAYREMYRVLKPGGRLLIGTINPESKWGQMYKSEEFRRNSIFKYARFMTMDELKGLDRDNLKRTGECLFIPPDADEESISWDEENRLSGENEGGFICALWRK
jgi:ubiquinone/menaquinone biosynthesis C-methylase UbiE